MWTVAVIALTEFLVMQIIDLIEVPNGIWKNTFDSVLLAALSAPLLYLRLARGAPVRGDDTGRKSLDRALPTLEEVERLAVIQALEVTHGDCRHAAKVLGIGRATIYRKLRKYGLSRTTTLPHAV
jgi:transcriptional regulator of acetoin/glycerol metabolism